METASDFTFLASKIAADSNCSHKIKKKKMLAPWKKNCGKLRHCIKKQRHHFVDKISIVKAMGFPVVMYGCESWTTKKAEG